MWKSLKYIPSLYGNTDNRMYSLASCGMYTTFKVENTLQMRKNKIHSQCVCDIIGDTPGIHTIFIWKYKWSRMYALASCCMYATFKVETPSRLRKIKYIHNMYVYITTLNGYIGSTYNYICTVSGYIDPLM